MKNLFAIALITSVALVSCQKEIIKPNQPSTSMVERLSSDEKTTGNLIVTVNMTKTDVLEGTMNLWVGNSVYATVDLSTVDVTYVINQYDQDTTRTAQIPFNVPRSALVQSGGWASVEFILDTPVTFFFNKNTYYGKMTFAWDNLLLPEPSYKIEENTSYFVNNFWVKNTTIETLPAQRLNYSL